MAAFLTTEVALLQLLEVELTGPPPFQQAPVAGRGEGCIGPGDADVCIWLEQLALGGLGRRVARVPAGGSMRAPMRASGLKVSGLLHEAYTIWCTCMWQ
jgi:hypothetical protein